MAVLQRLIRFILYNSEAKVALYPFSVEEVKSQELRQLLPSLAVVVVVVVLGFVFKSLSLFAHLLAGCYFLLLCKHCLQKIKILSDNLLIESLKNYGNKYLDRYLRYWSNAPLL